MIPLLSMACISFLLLMWLRLFDKSAFSGYVRVNFPLFIGVGWFLYSFFYMLEKSFVANQSSEDVQFFFDCNIAVFSMIVGALLVRKKKKLDKNKALHIFKFCENNRVKDRGVIIVASLIALLMHLYIKAVFGGWYIYFTQKYGEYVMEGVNSFTSIVPMICASFVLVANSRYVLKSRFSVQLVLFFSVMIVAIFFAGGNRNNAMMILLALLWGKFYQTKVNIYLLLPILTIVMVVAAANAVLREYGIINLFTGQISVTFEDIRRFALAVSEGEFGTMARVSHYNNEFNFSYSNMYGLSYLIDPIVNMVPTVIYPERPDTIAVKFTEQYWGVSKGTLRLIGLGFSPIIEAKINFQYLWFIVFITFGFISRYFINYFERRRSFIGFFVLGSLSITSLNFFRIDFAIFTKFSLLIFGMCLFINSSIKHLNRVKIN